jgi:hypothetical protein
MPDRTPNITVHGLMAVLVTAVASSVVGFILLAVFVPHTGRPVRSGDLPVIAAIVLIWAPAFALVPAGILGWLVERPKARAMIARRAGGFVPHLALSVAAVTLFWLLFRIAVHLTYPTNPLIDLPSLALFVLIGLCSGLSWWFMVVLPGRRA